MVANAFAVMYDMFSGKRRVVAPRQFKLAIGEVVLRFMSFLLDGQHEDLNQIIDKSETEAVESDGRMTRWRRIQSKVS